MNLSLDDQKKLALAAYPKIQWSDNGLGQLAADHSSVRLRDVFNPTSPNTLMRLITNPDLKISTTWHKNGLSINVTLPNGDYKAILLPKPTPEQIADAIIECSLQVIKEDGE